MNSLSVNVLIALNLLIFVQASINSVLKCPDDCSRLMCMKGRHLKKICKNGIVYEACGCCRTCAKGEGDICGGPMDMYGKCGERLMCYPPKVKPGDLGTCQPIPNKPPQSREKNGKTKVYEKKCHPKCTFEFCSKWPNSICSALDNAVIDRSCQRKCQHTHCQACYFKTKRESPCPRCATDDFECMKTFASCIRHETCTKHKYPCEAKQKRKIDGKFICKVAPCTK
ncbi:uncharacterized protein LOC130647973 [Hydractinia symbiolongicarpus]|uniref:uncharacterized protein LOC130647973 n=1 Tax=Hydractinia symbiolongicarpus TaxID=13093 RepID=UPI00254DF26B|nr:uncharacterized protein LOC130647973 [Hydractinia symbiolongicarpus]